jgi:hypothetical protein
MHPTTTDPALRRVQQSINRSAGQHKRAISEGTRSAQAILRRPSMTTDPLLLKVGADVDQYIASQTGPRQPAKRPSDQPSPLERTDKQQEADETALGLRIVVATMTIFGAVIGYAIWSALQ